MIVDSCVAVPAASSMWTVQRRRSFEDRSGLCVSLERRGRHAQLNAATDGWGDDSNGDVGSSKNTDQLRVL